MAKAQHSPDYRVLTAFLRELRESAGLTQRQLGRRLRKPQSWVYNSETGNRRLDLTEFIVWTRGCGADPVTAFVDLVAALS